MNNFISTASLAVTVLLSITQYSRVKARAVFDGGGSGGLTLPPQEVVDPQKVLQNLFGGSTLTP